MPVLSAETVIVSSSISSGTVEENAACTAVLKNAVGLILAKNLPSNSGKAALSSLYKTALIFSQSVN